MPLFFFDLHDDEVFHPDTEGTELKDVAAARSEAAQAFAEISREVLPGNFAKRLTMTVRTAAGEQLFELELDFRLTATA